VPFSAWPHLHSAVTLPRNRTLPGSRSVTGWSTLHEQECVGKLFLVGRYSQSTMLCLATMALCHDISPSPFKQHTREMRDNYNMCIQNVIPAIRTWCSSIVLCPISCPDSTKLTQARGTVSLCLVSSCLWGQKVVVVNHLKVVQEPVSSQIVLLLLSNDIGA